jgi:ABC-type lipoprotein export system ATPase subunit
MAMEETREARPGLPLGGAPALQLRDLVKTYPSPSGPPIEVIHLPSLVLQAGQQVALRGESGLGKTTLLHMIAGIVIPDSGQVEIGGVAMTRLSEAGRDRLRAEKVGYLFQTFNLLQGLTALENVNLGLAFGRGADAQAAFEALDRVGLSHRAHYLPRQLSTGQQQRVAVARALANRPCLILADEPTGNLDRARGAKIIELLQESAAELGAALLVASHDPEVLAALGTTIDLADLNQARPQMEDF